MKTISDHQLEKIFKELPPPVRLPNNFSRAIMGRIQQQQLQETKSIHLLFYSTWSVLGCVLIGLGFWSAREMVLEGFFEYVELWWKYSSTQYAADIISVILTTVPGIPLVLWVFFFFLFITTSVLYKKLLQFQHHVTTYV